MLEAEYIDRELKGVNFKIYKKKRKIHVEVFLQNTDIKVKHWKFDQNDTLLLNGFFGHLWIGNVE